MTKSNLDTSVEWKWFPVKELAVVWPGAQRPIRPAHLKALCDAFDPELFDPVHVSAVVKAPALRHIIDGSHRKTMVEQLFGANEQIPCIVHDDCTTEARAAEIFRDINKSRRSPSAVEDFKVAVASGSETHVEIDRIVRKAGHTINSGSDGNTISAVQSLLSVYSRHGAKVLDGALRTLQKTWPDDRAAFQGPIILGYGLLLFDYSKIDRERLIGKIGKKFSPGTLLAAAKTLKHASAKPISVEIEQVLINHYNVGLRESQKLIEPTDKEGEPRPFRGYTNGRADETGFDLSLKPH